MRRCLSYGIKGRVVVESEADQLIAAAAAGTRRLNTADLDRVLDHVARAGFDPDALERAGGRLRGIEWGGRTLAGRDRLPPAEVHYLRHVVAMAEWPVGTTFGGYLASLAQIIADPLSGVFTGRYHGGWQLGIIRRSASWRGPWGHEWILIEYRLATGHWTTAFQPENGLDVLVHPERSDVRWLRLPG